MVLLFSYAKSGDAEEIVKNMEEFKPKINERDRSDSICRLTHKKTFSEHCCAQHGLGGNPLGIF